MIATRAPFATAVDLQAAYGDTVAVLAADETTRLVDPARVANAVAEASTAIRVLLASRYTADEIAHADEDSLGVLRLFCMDIALYRVAYPPRQTEALLTRYNAAITRLQAMARGVGALTIMATPTGGAGAPGTPDAPVPTIGSPNEALISANERLFTRRRYGSAG